MKRYAWLVLLMAPLTACGGEPDTGDMPKQAAIAKCARAVQKQGADEVTAAATIKADRYWEVTGTTTTGTFHCVINAVNEDVVVASHGT